MSIIESSFILVFARLTLAAVMLYYGWPKIRNLRKTAGDFVGMGFSPGWAWGSIVAVTEFVGGLAMVAGVWVELVAAMFGFQMLLGALWKKKINKPFPDYSYDILALTLAAVLMRFGAGAWAVASAPFTLARWELAIGALVVALIAVTLSKPRMRS